MQRQKRRRSTRGQGEGTFKKGIEDAKLMKKMVKIDFILKLSIQVAQNGQKRAPRYFFSSGTKVEYFDELYTFEKDSLKAL